MARLKQAVSQLEYCFKDLDRPLVLVVDMINGFVVKGALADGAILNIAKPIEELLKQDFPTYFIKDSHTKDALEFQSFKEHCLSGQYESDVIEQLKPYEKKADSILKNSTNAFHALDIKKLLKIGNSFIIVGCCSDICILQLALSLKTYLNEHNIDKKVIVVSDCIETYHTSEHDAFEYNYFALKLMQQSGIEVIERFIN